MSNGQQWGTVIGGIVGAFFGMPQVGMAIGGMIGGAIDPEVIKAPGIGDAQRQTTQAGVPRPVVFGHPAPFMGNIIDGEHKARKITVEEGGKGGPVVESERFILTSAIRICEGPIAGVVRIWRNGEVVYDRRSNADMEAVFQPEGGSATTALLRYIAEMRAKTAEFQNRVRIYLGDEDQLPDPALEAIHGVGNTPYYRGTAYMVIEDDDVTDTRGACAQYQFEVMAVGSEESVVTTLVTTSHGVAGVTGNPGDLLYEDTSEPSFGETTQLVMQITVTPATATPNLLPARIQVLASNQILYDSGWRGDPSFQAQLNTVLTNVERTDLIGGIVAAPVEDTTATIYPPAAGLPLSFRVYAVGSSAEPGLAATIEASYTQYDEDDLPGSPMLVPGLDGVIIGDDGLLYAPDFITTADVKAITAGSVLLSEPMAEIAARCGVPAAAVNVDALTDIIPGFLIAVQGSGADCIRPCQQMYFFDMPEFDGQIVAVKRGGPSVATITDDYMLEAGSDDDDTRAQPVEFPLKVSVITRDPAADYNPMPQTSSRFSSTVKALGETQIASPIPFGADEAARRADIIHKVLWAAAEGRSEFELPEEWTRLVPSDCYDRNGKRWMVESTEYAEGAVRLRAVYDRASNYTSTATGQAAPPPVLPESGLRGPTVLAVMNLPPLREQDNVAGAYLAVAGQTSGWNGCTVQMSIDGGATYRTVATIGRASVMGWLTGDVTVSTEPVPVRLVRGELSDTTEADLARGANAFALVPGAGLSEIGQFTTATEGSSLAYDLTGVSRGVLSTSAAAHSDGEQFVMLANALFLPIDSSLYDTTLFFRAITNGAVPESAQPISFLYQQVPTISYMLSESGNFLITESGNRITLE